MWEANLTIDENDGNSQMAIGSQLLAVRLLA